ncbi:MAG: D-aminoacyl-tRNA deacylase [Alicyclobacillaceae bacterium]|uniref:D-aminoacyl-tRNA deacylase n=1 Tax=Alicyclobacillus sp. SP_1 TaxID=2942475 RepID=UPI0021587908|nr:D-aminoacyl-tRNA deacylase [Alicyclobacillus sp. SP_1]MCY0888348.1 D-aminoacyl-tRNA deacylase [Alicyclobacillaceae bacterium]MCY0895708.1 D-aminoacyl-tRNA deacylase [Alicyclobacillaceae bacterium]
MRVVVQRSGPAKVWVDDRVVGAIDGGLVLLVGVTHGDTERDVDYLAEKTAHLRIFEDESDKMNRSVLDVGLSILSISQFTLYGDCRKGRRPNFMEAASPHLAEPLYDSFNQALRRRGLTVATGVFGAMMKVELVNDGPVTLLLES